MNRFDVYISTITDGLRVSKKKKEELGAEFLDHLELLQAEYENRGFSQTDSAEKAIERFGEWRDIKMMLQKSLINFRSFGTILFGVIATIGIICFGCIPMAGFTFAYHAYGSTVDIPGLFLNNARSVVLFILLFMPIGYFLPIVLNRNVKIFTVALVSAFLGILAGLFFGIALMQCVYTAFLLAGFVLGLSGGVAGYAVLLAINKLNMSIQERRRYTGESKA